MKLTVSKYKSQSLRGMRYWRLRFRLWRERRRYTEKQRRLAEDLAIALDNALLHGDGTSKL